MAAPKKTKTVAFDLELPDEGEAPDETRVLANEIRVLASARELLAKLFQEADIPESHGLAHCEAVLEHAKRAIAEDVRSPGMTAARRLAVLLAALLHEADDRKYFDTAAHDEFRNAQVILESALGGAECEADGQITTEVLEMISYVSCSATGNSIPERAETAPEFLWPRWSDRLEAIGEGGAQRCIQYSAERGRPFSTPETPRPTTVEEVWEEVTEARFARYLRQKTSRSTLDHFYDKLLPVAAFMKKELTPAATGTTYFESAAEQGADPLVSLCIARERAERA